MAVACQRLLRTGCKFLVAELHVDCTVGDVYLNDVAILYLSDVATSCSLRRDVSDAES